MSKRAIKTKKRAGLPLTQEPRSFLDYLTGTSRLSRNPPSTSPDALSTFKTGLSNLKGLAAKLPGANPFEFDNTVAQQAKGLSTKNRKMKKRSKLSSKGNVRSEATKDKEMSTAEGGVKNLDFDEKHRTKKRAAKEKESKSELAKDKKQGIKEGSQKDEAMDAKGMRKHRGSIKKSGSFKGKSNKLGFGGRAAQMKAQGVPGGVIGAIARKEGAAPGGPNYHGGKKRAVKKRGIGNAIGKATGWPGGVNSMNLNKSGTIGTEPISKGNNKYTEIKAGPLGKLDIPMGTLKDRKKRQMPQRRTNRSMSGMDLLKKATRARR